VEPFLLLNLLEMKIFCILLVTWISSKLVTMLLDYQEEGI